MSTSALIHAGIEQAINQYLALDPATQKKVAAMHGKVIAIEVVGLGHTLYLIPSPDQLQVLSYYEGEPDCTLRGTPLALSRMGNNQQSSAQLFSGEVSISGSTDLAHEFGKILSQMNIDWEARLTPYIGSLMAEDLVSFAKGSRKWGEEVMGGINEDLRGFLQNELQLLPQKEELEQFLESVDHTRDDVERLEARIALLEQSRNRGNKG